MKRFIGLLLFTFALLWPAAAQESKTVSETLSAGANDEVVVDNYKGGIEVTTWDRSDVEVTARVVSDGNDELVADTDILISQSSGVVHIKTDYERAKRRNRRLFSGQNSINLPLVYYSIHMPRTNALTIDDYKSEIEVTGLNADLRLETYKGEVRMADIRGDVRVETYKGNVRVRELAGSLQAETYKGQIDADFNALLDDTSFDTYRGEITLTIPRDAGFRLDADLGRRGDLNSDVDFDQLRRDKRTFRGDVNGGGPLLAFETYRGSLDVRTRGR